MKEKGLEFFKETQLRLGRVDRALGINGGKCTIELLGVSHIGDAPEAIISKLRAADIVTLELTRGVVERGLSQESSELFKKNPFWLQLISGLKETREGKVIKGVEVNQTPRVAWKRFSLHRGIETLAPSVYSIEINSGDEGLLESLLPNDEYERFVKFGWLTSKNTAVIYSIGQTVLDALKRETQLNLPLRLNENSKLVCVSHKEDDNRDYSITFLKTPHTSLDEAHFKLLTMLTKYGFLTPQEAESVSNDIIMTYLLSSSDLTEAEEIAYFINQRLRNSQDQPPSKLKAVHVGGAFHTTVVKSILESCTSNPTSISINTNFDPRVSDDGEDFLAGNRMTFFRDRIPFTRRIKALEIKEADVEVDAEAIVYEATNAVNNHFEEFKKSVFISRIISETDFIKRFSNHFYPANQAHLYLQDLSLDELNKMLNK